MVSPITTHPQSNNLVRASRDEDSAQDAWDEMLQHIAEREKLPGLNITDSSNLSDHKAKLMV
jgi:hypothetical protein